MPGSFDAEQWCRVYQHVLAQTGLGIVVVDQALRIEALSPEARPMLAALVGSGGVKVGGPVPSSLAGLISGAREHATSSSERSKAIPVPAPSGRVFYLTLTFPSDLPLAPIVITIRQGALRGEELLQRLRARFELSPREAQLVELLRQGRSNREIGEVLGLTEGTVKNYLYVLFQKLGIPCRSALPPLLDQL